MDTTEHMCKRCLHIASTKSNLLSHLRNKKTCKVNADGGIAIDVTEQIKELLLPDPTPRKYACPHCNRQFNSRQSKSRHLSTCKANKEYNPIESEVDSTSETVSLKLFLELKEQVDKLSHQLKSQNTEALANFIQHEVKTCIQEMGCQQTTNADEDSKQFLSEMNCSQADAPSSSLAIRRRQKIKSSKRRLVWKTYIGMTHGEVPCLCCKSNNIDMFNFHCGHVVSNAEGGTIDLSNLRPICSVCNSTMGAMDMRQFAKEEFGVEIA